ncbi:MAG TPA: aminotransferase class I/II-fold pyridoxal phosphate-dependent enzyme, partial [Hyphomicrobium sp.]|nr:aminotransferase class I/II-fold pyridoxal phosphate-dependent enzyme [Hyphomicrobium sp.]
MFNPPMSHPLSSLTSGAISSPFSQLRKLLAGIAPGHETAIELTIGEPREAMPDFIQAKLDEATALYGKYPPIRGAEDARKAISEWLSKRYALPGGVDPERDVLVLNGSREGLFFACLPAVGRKDVNGQPAILMCNPYYSAYVAGAIAVGAEPVYLNAPKDGETSTAWRSR